MDIDRHVIVIKPEISAHDVNVEGNYFLFRLICEVNISKPSK